MNVKTYMMLTKPGIIIGNVITTAAGFMLASGGNMDLWLFLATLVGLSFVVASAGVFNNCYDRAIDAQMERTKDRALVKGTVSLNQAIIFASFLGVFGFVFLSYFTNVLAAFVALAGFGVYLVLYAFWKYRSFYGTLVGSIAGAVPPVVGYTAYSGRLDTGAWLIFAILVLWQMPHFFAIAIYRFNDYKAASIPVLPVAKGMYETKVQMALYIVAYTLTTILLTLTGYTGNATLIIATLLGLLWLALCLRGFKARSDYAWAKQMFAFSLVVIMTLCVTITLDAG